ncbi:MAG: hypothetical protein ACLPN1_19120 [Dissulfurispiraceae bacterium]
MNRKNTSICACIASGLAGVLCVTALSTAGDLDEGRSRTYPYGESRGGYGQRRAVSSAQEARRTIREYFAGRGVKIGDIRERELFYEAEVRDRRGALVDKVIIDKRTGRIRSTY